MAKRPTARDKIGLPTDRELQFLQPLVTTHITAGMTAREMEKCLNEPQSPYTTFLTVLQILERKGYIRSVREGKANRYFAVITLAQLQQKMISAVRRSPLWMDALFSGKSPEFTEAAKKFLRSKKKK